MATQNSPLLELKDVGHSYVLDSGQKLKVIQDISLSLMPHESLVVLGPSGSGKSTLLRILAGLIEPTQGDAYLRGKPLESTNPEVAMVFQHSALLPWFNVQENISMGLRSQRLPESEVRERVKRAIDLVGLEGFEEAYPRELSGGMKQRVGLARAIVMERPILCLDEPFSALDVLAAEGLRKEVLNLWLSRKTSIESLVLITHNIIEAASIGSRILVLGSSPGQIKISFKNDLPYPRDERSAAFKSLVDDIHDVITEAIIPDTPEWVPPALSANITEAVPPVPLNEMIGLLEIISGQGGKAEAFTLAQKLMKDSVQILLMAKAAELLDLVDTPKNAIILTDMGRRFVASDINGRKKMFHEQLRHLKVTKLLERLLESQEELTLSWDDCIQSIQEWLPNENPEQVLDTLITWGRYGEVFGYNDDTKMVYLDRGQEVS